MRRAAISRSRVHRISSDDRRPCARRTSDGHQAAIERGNEKPPPVPRRGLLDSCIRASSQSRAMAELLVN